jgi:hypothetical protein
MSAAVDVCLILEGAGFQDFPAGYWTWVLDAAP